MWAQSANGHDVTNQAIIHLDSIVSGRNYDMLALIITQLLTSRSFPDLCRYGVKVWCD